MAAGTITQRQVKECLISHSREETGDPVGARLLEVARGDHEVLVQIVNRHTADLVMQLMYWNSGIFRLVVPPTPVRFAVEPSINVENLLLEAYRRADEGERPRREKISVDEELCVTCTLECSQEIKNRYLKPDVCLWRNMPSILRNPVFRNMRSGSSLDVDDSGELPFL